MCTIKISQGPTLKSYKELVNDNQSSPVIELLIGPLITVTIWDPVGPNIMQYNTGVNTPARYLSPSNKTLSVRNWLFLLSCWPMGYEKSLCEYHKLSLNTCTYEHHLMNLTLVS